MTNFLRKHQHKLWILLLILIVILFFLGTHAVA